jgi:4-amino-4-deoxy-L-arabinose transferase-like glycosyltransferase
LRYPALVQGNTIKPVLVRLAPLWVVLIAAAALLVAPIGYVGAGADDTHYLNAARCWVAAGSPCVPDSHWASRWPAIAPMVVFTAFFGESRLTVGLGPLAAWTACIALVAALGRAWFDRATGCIAAALLAATPVVTQAALQPSVDTTELALQLAALLLATFAYERQSVLLSAGAGAAAAIAMEARDTSVVFCAAAGLAWLFLDPARRKVLLWSIPGFAGVAAAELAAYAAVTGDPFYRFRLALGHVGVPTTELAANVDTRRSPLFNPAYVAGWRREADVAWWWPLDPWLNLIASPRIGLTLAGTLLVLPIGWKTLPMHRKRALSIIVGMAVAVSAGLIYALAVDPKPRMFLALVASCSIAAAAIAVSSWRSGRGAVPACVLLLVILGGFQVLSGMARTHDFELQARHWIKSHPGAIEVGEGTATMLTLVPEARALPAAGSGRPLRIRAAPQGCRVLGAPVVARAGAEETGELCLIRVVR